jgi:pimeloyl-ACP methyl ester carboxylesterase/DNA-binding CsgD family transcriptional regulator
VPDTPDRDFKERELEILRLLSAGLTDRAIATRLHLAADTVRWYNKQLYLRLGVSSRGDAVQRARQLGLLQPSERATPRAPVERSPIRYVNNAGVSIAYQVVGNGPVDLVFIPGFVSHLELSWEDPGYAMFFDTLGRHARVLVFDKRGVGLSDRAQGASTIAQTISDARAVMRAAGSRRAFVSGTSEGGAAAVLLASMFPDEVRGLVLIASTPMVTRHGAAPSWAHPRAEYAQRMARIVESWGEPWTIERFAPTQVGNAPFEAWWTRALRSASSPASVKLTMQQAMQVDIRPLLPQVRTRTLVVHRVDDVITRIGAGRYLATRMPNATIVELPGADHLFFVQGQPIAQAIVRFVSEPSAEPEVDSWLAIILQAEGPGARLTDDVRRLLEAMDARHIRPGATGWMACFDAPNRAIHCAERLRAPGRGWSGAMALHVGACRTSDGAPMGTASAISQRLVDLAAAGEILLSSTLRDILSGSDLPMRARAIDGGDDDAPPMTVWELLPSRESAP